MTASVTVETIPEFDELYNPEWRYIIFHGGRGSGKSYNIAESLILRGRNSKLRILCTREIQNTIKDSVHKLLCDIIDKYDFWDYSRTKDGIKNEITGSEFIFKGLRHNVTEIKSMEGIDVCWVEEAQSVSSESWDTLTPTIRKPGSQIIISFNRLNELDPVWTKFCEKPDEHTYIKKINFDVMDKYGLLPEVLEIERQRDKRTLPPSVYTWKWEGEPLGQNDNAILTKDEILKAFERQADQNGAVELGVDVARMGDDRTVIVKRKGWQLLSKTVLKKKRTDQVADYVKNISNGNKEIQIKVDDTGVGGGVTDILQRDGFNVAPVNFGGKPKDSDKYPNVASEMWFNIAEHIEDIGLGERDSELLEELSSREWSMDSKGRRMVEPKDKYKKRQGKSPDNADAVILAFYEPKTADWLSAEEMF